MKEKRDAGQRHAKRTQPRESKKGKESIPGKIRGTTTVPFQSDRLAGAVGSLFNVLPIIDDEHGR